MCLLADRFARYCGTMYSRHLLWYPVHYLRRMVKSCISYIAPLGAASKRSIMLVPIFNTDPGRTDCSLHSSTFAAGRLERLLCRQDGKVPSSVARAFGTRFIRFLSGVFALFNFLSCLYILPPPKILAR